MVEIMAQEKLLANDYDLPPFSSFPD